MSIHTSLRGVDTLTGERSVLKRIERIQELQRKGKFDPENDSAFGLPKVRTKFKVISGKKAKALEAAAKAAAEAHGEGEGKAAASADTD